MPKRGSNGQGHQRERGGARDGAPIKDLSPKSERPQGFRSRRDREAAKAKPGSWEDKRLRREAAKQQKLAVRAAKRGKNQPNG